MSKKIKGMLKGCRVPGTAETGYRNTWDMGRAAGAKKRTRLKGPDTPGT